MRPARRAHVRSGLDLEQVRRQALQTDRRPGLGSAGPRILSHAGHDVPPARDRPAVEGVHVSRVEAAVVALAFGAEPETVAILADPAARIPGDATGGAALPLELIEQHEIVHRAVMHRVPHHVGERGDAVGGGHRRDERRQLDGGRQVRRVILPRRHRRRWGVLVRRVRCLRRGQRRKRRDEHRQRELASHDCRPSSTRTSRNMPASMWNSRWQW